MRAEKESMAKEIKEKIDGSVFVIFADYQGLTVSKTEELRTRLHDADARFQVVSNKMVGLASESLKKELGGPSAMVYGNGDVVQVSKIIRDFVKENELPVVKIGQLEGALLSTDELKTLASLPSREQLLAQVVGTVAAPMMQLVGVMSQKVASLVYVLKAIQEKKDAA